MSFERDFGNVLLVYSLFLNVYTEQLKNIGIEEENCTVMGSKCK